VEGRGPTSKEGGGEKGGERGGDRRGREGKRLKPPQSKFSGYVAGPMYGFLMHV